ncbi:MAG: glycoside hydrolase family 66 protein [Paludibacteraceae bacterium]|nr:glycoside hydrolase family 66 protein [Paludibacteraceae bacterium]
MKRFASIITLNILMVIGMMACNGIDPVLDPITYGENYIAVQLSTDKACYAPGESVVFSLNQMPGASAVMVRYRHMGETVEEHVLTSTQWTWRPPTQDYRGYLVDLYVGDSVYASVAVDVSSTPEKFVRNGFLSAYGNLSQKEIMTVVNSLNRFHINYVQFQDWHWKHHRPLAGTTTSPMDVWTDIISRNCYRSTVDAYITAAHERNMQCLFYNLLYGALNDAHEDGVSRDWYVFSDRQHNTPVFHPLSSPFKSAIYVVNPNNKAWQTYLGERNNDVYQVFDFDGWQIDQLGPQGNVYDYNGNSISLIDGFAPMIEYSKQLQPEKRLVMNAVGQYGQDKISKTPVDFLYTEVWDKPTNRGYTVLSDVITKNYTLSGGKATVLAAYMDYNHGIKGRGYFNTSGVLMTTAAAHAWGGTILQMGEHMLCNEYFPNSNLSMHGDLYRAMIAYYDFITAYENLLRDGGEWFGVDVESMDKQCVFNQWPAVKGQVATVGKAQEGRDIIHLLSYRNAVHLDWCDTNANQGEPDLLTDLSVRLPAKMQPAHVYVATPDANFSVAQELDFDYADGMLTLTVPSLKYWTMLWIEYE